VLTTLHRELILSAALAGAALGLNKSLPTAVPARVQNKFKSAISGINLLLCLTGSATAEPVEDMVRSFRPLPEHRDGHTECLSSADAVWAAHPGSHAAWTLRLPEHEGEKCWFARDSTNVPTKRVPKDGVVNSPSGAGADLRTDGQTKRGAGQAKPSVGDRPDESSTRSESQGALPPQGPPSILIWGKPMWIDATWEEMFARRER
jgi:hypothetical protein